MRDFGSVRRDRLAPLGLQRNRIFGCLSGDIPSSPAYFMRPDDADIFAAFRTYISEQSRRGANDPDSLTISLLAAGRLLTGDLSAAELIIDHLPAEPLPAAGTGQCLRASHQVLAAALPLPRNLKDTRRWAQNTTEQAALRVWSAAHRDKLRWVDGDGVYRRVG
jgi:hypothetical protein